MFADENCVVCFLIVKELIVFDVYAWICEQRSGTLVGLLGTRSYSVESRRNIISNPGFAIRTQNV